MGTYGIESAFGSWYGATIMIILIIMSVYMVALVFVRMIFFVRMKTDSHALLRQTQQAVNSNDPKLMAELKGDRQSDTPNKILVSLGLSNLHMTQPELGELFAITRIRQRDRMNRGLGMFGTFAAIAPFIGLLGTVLGIVNCFTSLAQTGASGPNVVAAGVAEALWATAMGLFVAIPAVVAYNIFKSKAKDIMTDMEVTSRELLLILKGEKKVMPKLTGAKA